MNLSILGRQHLKPTPWLTEGYGFLYDLGEEDGKSRGTSGLRKTKYLSNSLAHRTAWEKMKSKNEENPLYKKGEKVHH